MKRIACIIVALMLCATAFAATTSKTTADTSTVSVPQEIVEAYSEGEEKGSIAVDEDADSEASQEASAALEGLLAAVESATTEDMTEEEAAEAVSKAVDAYFQSNGNTIETVEGESVTLSEFLIPEGKAGTVTIDEVFPIVVKNFSNTLDDESVMVPTTFKVASTYEKGEKVAVLIGFAKPDGSIQWIALEGVYDGEGVVVDIPGNIFYRIQNEGGATVAIASADIS